MADRLAAAALVAALALLGGCASGPRSGRDGAPSNPPADAARTPDAEPRVEAIRGNGGTSKPYTVLGRSYVPITDDRPLRESGLASWYGTKFHHQPTASGELYDMNAMTAAHKTLPLPSYVRVRNPANGAEAIVRVNDRGPFHDDRVIDLSYAAAARLDLLRGVAPVEIERITNDDIRTGAWRRPGDRVLAQPLPAGPAGVSVPIAMTTPVVDAPRSMVSDLPPLGLPPASTAAPTTPGAGRSTTPPPDIGPATAGFWVQIGAFSQRDGAANFQDRVTRQMPVLAEKLAVFSDNGMHRLQAGPFASRDAALMLGEQVRNGLGLAPIVVERR